MKEERKGGRVEGGREGRKEFNFRVGEFSQP